VLRGSGLGIVAVEIGGCGLGCIENLGGGGKRFVGLALRFWIRKR